MRKFLTEKIKKIFIGKSNKIELVKKADGIFDIEFNGRSAGICKYNVSWNEIHLNEIVIEEEYSNLGICTSILQFLSTRYGKPIILSDATDIPNFYEKRGFRQNEYDIKKCGWPEDVISECKRILREHNTVSEVNLIE